MEKEKDVDKYIESVPMEFRDSLKHLRELVFKYIPDGEETFAYQIAVYKYMGKALFSIAAFKDHYSFVTQDKNIADKIPELKDFKISGTTIHFTKEKPATDELVRKLIAIRVADRKK